MPIKSQTEATADDAAGQHAASSLKQMEQLDQLWALLKACRSSRQTDRHFPDDARHNHVERVTEEGQSFALT